MLGRPALRPPKLERFTVFVRVEPEAGRDQPPKREPLEVDRLTEEARPEDEGLRVTPLVRVRP